MRNNLETKLMTRLVAPVFERFVLTLGLTLGLTLALAAPAGATQADAPPPAAPAAAGSAPAPASSEDTRQQALLSFQHDLISIIALQGDALPLMGGALLARPLTNLPTYHRFHSLIERAAQAPNAGPEVSWTQLNDCDAKAQACPNSNALNKLIVQAPDNAAVWLFKLGVDDHNDKHSAARNDLAKAAAAKLYDDYTGLTLKALAITVPTLPPPPATINPQSAAGASGVQVMLTFGLASLQPQTQPGLQATAHLCESGKNDPTIKADCLKLGKILEWGSSPLARSLGLHLREALADDPAQQEDARRARRTLIWQVQNFSQLSTRSQSDAGQAQHLLSLARAGGTEMSLLLTALRDAGISVDPPANWSLQHAATQPH